MIAAVLWSYLWAPISYFLARYDRKFGIWIISCLPLTLFFYFLWNALNLQTQQYYHQLIPWVSELGLNLQFKGDGLSFLFALIITGIGFLILIYSSSYFNVQSSVGRFYSLMILFMASMLGLVFSDNLLVLLGFWELTSLISFFLIGFEYQHAPARKSATKVLITTFIGGISLLIGILLLGNIAGGYEISMIIASKEIIYNHPNIYLSLVFILIGAFSKSAQFPFHFWLPEAMCAPTPASAYLHSATMVKAGIFLLLKLYPIFYTLLLWKYTLFITGTITILVGGILSIISIDLKKILAYSTINALGMMVLLLSIDHIIALQAIYIFIIAHALYKAALFLITGIIQSKENTRVITALSGLRYAYPLLTAVTLSGILLSIAAPPGINFIAKELILSLLISHPSYFTAYIIPIVISSACIIISSLSFGITPFFSALKKPNKASRIKDGLLAPPAILIGIGIIWGIFPFIFPDSLRSNFLYHTTLYLNHPSLQLFHGLNATLLLSLSSLALGIILYFLGFTRNKISYLHHLLSSYLEFKISSKLSQYFLTISYQITQFFQNGFLRYYLISIFLSFIALIFFFSSAFSSLDIEFLPFISPHFFEVIIMGLIVGAIFTSVFIPTRLAAIASLGVIGFGIALLFVFLGAPDLAITHFTTDILSVIIFVLIAYKLPKYFWISKNSARIRDGLISIIIGTLVAFSILIVLKEKDQPGLKEYFVENSYIKAKGRNIVNVIVLDFRGIDTFLEVTVLSISALGVYSLMKLKRKKEKEEQP